MTEKKPFWTSKTLWANVVSLVMAQFMEYDNPETVVTALAMVNIGLRFITGKYLGV